METFLESLIAIIAILSVLVVPVVAIVFVLLKFQASKSKERMAIINQGMIPQEANIKKSVPNRLRTLRTALGAIGIGVAVIGIILNKYVLLELSTLENLAVLVACSSLFFGIGYITYYVISKDKIGTENEEE